MVQPLSKGKTKLFLGVSDANSMLTSRQLTKDRDRSHHQLITVGSGRVQNPLSAGIDRVIPTNTRVITAFAIVCCLSMASPSGILIIALL